MILFTVTAAVRRLRRRAADRSGARPGRSILLLLAGEAAHVAGRLARAPASVVVLLGLLAAGGLHVALGPAYPGYVATPLVRVAVPVLVLAGAVLLARAAPRSWTEVARMPGWRRLGLVAVAFAGLVSVVKVGLHETTPGPVLPAGLRWSTVAVLAVVAALAGIGRHRPHGS